MRAIAFDYFGTLADWFGTISDKFGPNFARKWMEGYHTPKEYRNLNLILEDRFDEIRSAASSRYRDLWSNLNLWADVSEALANLGSLYKIVALTNANHSMLKNCPLKWDLVVSAEDVKVYKPDPKIYLKAINDLKLMPEEILMVASHGFDLDAAKAVGMKTALIVRPTEEVIPLKQVPDIVVSDMYQLCAKL